jgi:hypothetical protein
MKKHMSLHRGPWILAHRPLEQNKASQLCPCQLTTASGVPVPGVLAGGEVRGGDGPVPHDLRRLLVKIGGDVLEGQQRSTAGDEQWRRPCRGVVVPSEGPAKIGEQGALEHRGSTEMLSPSSIWTETDRRGVIDAGWSSVLTGSDGDRRSAG